jgi:hypothetical protein
MHSLRHFHKINAEVDAGGFPGWLVNMKSKARQNNNEYEANWKEYLSAVDPYIDKHQIDQGGAVILYQIGNGVLKIVLGTFLNFHLHH